MAIPDFQSVMLPLLQALHHGQEASVAEIRSLLADHFGLSEEEREELLPSGTQPVFTNRVAWAFVYLQKAGLLKRIKRGVYQITERGLQALKEPLDRIDIGYLSQHPEFESFRTKSHERSEQDEQKLSPEETLQHAHSSLRNALVGEILEQLKTCSSRFFEHLVVELLVKMGYGGTLRDAGQAIGGSGDEGIDGIIKEDRLGLDLIYVQAKKWEGAVGRPEIQKFVGALHGKHARKGVFLTTGAFSSGAIDYAQGIDPRIVLIDGQMLAEYMIDFGLGVGSKANYEVKELDTDYFVEE